MIDVVGSDAKCGKDVIQHGFLITCYISDIKYTSTDLLTLPYGQSRTQRCRQKEIVRWNDQQDPRMHPYQQQAC